MIAVFHIVVAGYVVAHYCLRFDRVVHIVVVGYIVDISYFRFKRASGSYCSGWLYC